MSGHKRVVPMLGALLLAASITGCPRSNRPFLMDGGPGSDAADPTRVDTDLDGLCDEQEISRGLQIDDPDSDMDGFSDLAEVSLGFNALTPSSPDRDGIIFLTEGAGATARATMIVTVNGMGETYRGAFTPASQVFEDGLDASDFYASSGAVGAEPMVNVFEVLPEAQTFRGVRGRTNLVFEIRFTFDDARLSCLRGYPFHYTVQREDGRVVGVQRFTLVVQPEGVAPEDGEWCGARPCY